MSASKSIARFLGLTLLAAGLTAGASIAQTEWDVDGIEILLPHHETEAEWQAARDRAEPAPQFGALADPPPLAPVRNCAEWEPTTGVMIRYPLGLPYELLCDLDDNVVLHVVVASRYLTSAQNNFASNGVDMERVEFLVEENDSIWTRDYGPWFVFDGSGAIAIINHTYNRPYRVDDDLIPLYFGQQQGIPVYSHDMVHTGGNYMTDGAHISSSTRLVYDEALSENGMAETAVDQLMLDYYGVANYQVLDYIESGGIHHIDTWAKFLDEETVLVKETWPEHHTYAALEQRATLLASLEASTGRNYRVHRVHCQDIGGGDPASYTNSIILNDHIYVPNFGDAAGDSAAVAAYRAAAPGYSVDGYYYSGFITDDALHCRTKGVMDRGMLRVQHVPVHGEREGDVTIVAGVRAFSGEALTQVALAYRHGGQEWTTVEMTAAGVDSFTAVIPAPAATDTCSYYIAAADASGRTAGMPRTQPAAWYGFAQAPGRSAVGDAAPAARARLDDAWPNPFNPQVRISFELKYAEAARLTVFDARGRLVRTLVDGALDAGRHEYAWDGRDGAGRRQASGVYWYRLEAAGLAYTKPITLIK